MTQHNGYFTLTLFATQICLKKYLPPRAVSLFREGTQREAHRLIQDTVSET